MSEVEPRRYRIMSVLGKGGFGKVYRGRLEGPEGFYKDVAIKLLNDTDVPESTLQRFRDEARILGLIRDRAIVTVDPPTRLDGRWAVVMEYVDGVSCAAVLRNSPFPPRVAAELVQECARALDKVYRQPGNDGQPLKLLHRDLKPGNIQLTNSGEVKILDFGIARADFADREAETTHHIGGTIGYIAPERLGGMEGPEGDIYSLGVVLHVLITGDKPTRPGEFKPRKHNVERTEEVKQVLAFAKKMSNIDPAQRPTARQVEDGLNDLSSQIGGKTLRRWAEEIVPEAASYPEDGLVGNIVTETLANLPMMPDSLPDFTDRPKGANLTAIVMSALTGFFLLGALGLFMLQNDSVETIETNVIPTLQASPNVIQEPEAVVAPPVVAAEVIEKVVVQPKPAPSKPKPTVSARPRPKPAPAAAPQPTGPTYNISFSSIPFGAAVFIDGIKIGNTPLMNTPIISGEHKVRMESGTGSIERTIRAGRRQPNRFIWKGSDEWESQQ